MLVEAMSGSGGGSKGLPTGGFKLLAFAQSSYGGTFSVPSGTDFIICTSATSGNRWNYSKDVADTSYTLIDVLNNVGDSCEFSGTSYVATESQHQTVTWTNSTTVTFTRDSDSGALQLFACKYI